MLTTNRDLYIAIAEFEKLHPSNDRSLEQYLLALLGLTRQIQSPSTASGLSLSDFYLLLSQAFVADPIPFDASWRVRYDSLNVGLPGFPNWEATLIRQIVDLREMDESGTLRNEHRYLGVDAPRGASWYNFDPKTYLECAAAGSLGGWEPGDPTGRQLVPGQVAVTDSDGNYRSVDPQDIERPTFELAHLSWEELTEFIECGQYYE